jgi:HK97 family phage major capsid protein
VRRRRYELTEMYALIDVSNQMLEDSAFDMEGEIRGEATEQFAVKERAWPSWP